MDIKGHTVHRVLVAPAADINDEYYFSFLVDRANRDYLCIASVEGGVEIEVVAHENPDALAKVSIDPQTGVDDAKAAEIVAATKLPGRGRRRGQGRHQEALGRLHQGGRHAGRGEPAGACWATAPSRRSTARSPSTRTPTSATRTTRPSRTRPPRTRSRPKAKAKGLNYVKLDGEVGIIGNGAGPRDVHARRGRLRRREARRRQARELPRHRRRRVGRGDGQRPAHDPQRPAGQERVRERLRRHHRRATRSPTASCTRSRCSATRPTSRSSYASTATTSRRVAGSSNDANHPLVTLVDTMDGAADRAAELACEVEG